MSADGTAPVALDKDFVRAQFPAFSQPALADWVFMENAGGSYPAQATIDRLTGFYTRCKMQPYGAAAPQAEAGRLMDEGRERLAAYMNVAPEEVLVGPSTTQNVYVLAKAMAEILGPGDEIVVTDQDHEANSGAWRKLAERGVTVREWTVAPDTGHLDPAALAELLSERTRLVAFPQASNIVAELNPVAEICAMARAAGAWTVVDGVSGAPHGLPDAEALGADVYMFSTYKTYGPHQGVMVVRRAFNEAMPNQGHAFNNGYAEKRLVPAGPDHAQIAALAGMMDYFDALHAHHFGGEAVAPAERGRRLHAMMRAEEMRLTERLLAYTERRQELRLMGPRDPSVRASTVALAHGTRSGPELAEAMAAHGIVAGGSNFYAPRVIEAMSEREAHGVLRLSFLHYTTEAEIDRTIAALEAVL
ncbi:MAG: aminotransferase class V-fold PLP-dependent enzyme [Pseudomonadota bacterium]